MESEFPSNRGTERKRPEKPEVKKVDRIVQGEVVRRKKPLGRRLFEHFVGGETKGVWGYVAADVLIPAARDGVADAFHEAVDRIFLPDNRSRGRRSRRPGNGPYIDYNKQYRRDDPRGREDPRDRDGGRPSLSRRARASHDFDEIILPTRVEAEEVIDRMFDLVSQYEMVTVADLYDLVGLANNYTDEKWGWTDIRGAGVSRIKGGYLLDLPRPEPLD